MRSIIVGLIAALAPLVASAQQPPQPSIVEQRFAMCTLSEVRLQQALQEAHARIAELEKKSDKRSEDPAK
jgi:hypothetical protein